HGEHDQRGQQAHGKGEADDRPLAPVDDAPVLAQVDLVAGFPVLIHRYRRLASLHQHKRLEKALLHGDDVTGKHWVGELNPHRLVFWVAGANHLDLGARRSLREPAAECDGALDRQSRLIGNAARPLYLAVEEGWTI